MILVDANILLYAEDRLSEKHDAARSWWDEQLSGRSPVCLAWSTITAFVRIGTNPRAFRRPLSIREATTRVQGWLEQPVTRIIHATDRHWDILRRLLVQAQARANLVTDAHLAALAIEHGCVLCSCDADFSRFAELEWENPIG
jgi:toxin-antitoxin system PIN domain toxin